MKIKEIRLVDVTIKKDEDIIFKGKAEDIPKKIKECEYKNICFDGVELVIEL